MGKSKLQIFVIACLLGGGLLLLFYSFDKPKTDKERYQRMVESRPSFSKWITIEKGTWGALVRPLHLSDRLAKKFEAQREALLAAGYLTNVAMIVSNAQQRRAELVIRLDPSDLTTPRSKPRSVIAAELAPVLPGFFQSGLFALARYENRQYPRTPDYFEISPTTPEFSVPASGVPPFATTPASQCDRLIIVSGESQGWHIYGESSVKIQQRLACGDLTNPIRIV